MNSFRRVLNEIPATLQLAFPIALGMLGHMIIQLTDTLMLGHYGTNELAAAAFSGSLVMLILYGGLGFGQAVSALSSQALGANDPVRARGIYHLAARCSFAYSIVGVFITLAILPTFSHMHQSPEVVSLGKPFAILIALSFIPTVLFQTQRNYYESLKRPWTPFAYMLVLVLLNIFFNWVFIFGNLGAPRLGIVGSGLGTLLARTLVAIAFSIYVRQKGQPLHGDFDKKALPFDSLRKIFTIAIASGVQMIVIMLAYVVGGIWIGQMSVPALAANRIIGIIDATIFMIPIGFSYALSNRIGRAKGAGNLRSALDIYRGGFYIILVLYIIVAAWMILFSHSIIESFSHDAVTISVGQKLILIASVFCIFDGLAGISMGALRGLGDVVMPALVYLGLYWVLAMPLAYFLAFTQKMGPVGVWIGYCAGIIPAGLILVGRFVMIARGYITLKPRKVQTNKIAAA